MNKAEQINKAEESLKIKEFHRSRRMFCIYNDRLYVARLGSSYSHADWFKSKGWALDGGVLMDVVCRGIIDVTGSVYFYIGSNFKVNRKSEKSFFSHLSELVNRLKLNQDSSIYGGLIKSTPGKLWQPIKKYGKIKIAYHKKVPITSRIFCG